MGLDMYLDRVTKVPAIGESKDSTEVAYWRKANAIHAWFVENVQGGVDKCEPHEVIKKQLEELLLICNYVFETRDTEQLPTQGGFFFGSTDYDQWYLDDLKSTIEQLQKVVDETDWKNEKIIYQSSW